MSKQTKPRVITSCIANHFAGPTERIVEFYHPNGSGLISLRATGDGRITVDVYCCDATIDVRGPTRHSAVAEA